MSAFVDANVLAYAADESVPVPRKTRIARELLLQPGLHLSVQVLSEFVANARHPRKLNLRPFQKAEWLQRWLEFPVSFLTETTFVAALEFRQQFGLSHWDCLILASARESNCACLYSEDLGDEQDYGGVIVCNPFRS